MNPAPGAPIACSLSERELAGRRLWLNDLRQHARAIEPAADGLSARFPAEMEDDLRELARAEARCCPFLSIDVAHHGELVELRVSGPSAAQPLIRELFGIEGDR